MDQLRAQLSHRWTASRAACLLAAAALGLTLGCNDAPAGEVRRAPSPVSRGEGGSPFSLDSALTLFRRDLASVAELENAQPSIERVVGKLIQSLERSDTSALRALVMSRREFAYLYYPTSPFTRAPTKQEPGLAWFLHLQQSQKGVTRLLNRYGGRPLRVIRNDCKGPARIEGKNVLWNDCMQTFVAGKDTIAIRLFGGVYERNGRFKILSYGNDL